MSVLKVWSKLSGIAKLALLFIFVLVLMCSYVLFFQKEQPKKTVNKIETTEEQPQAKVEKIYYIDEVKEKEIIVSGASFKIADKLAPLFQEKNRPYLKDAEIAFSEENGTITNITKLILKTGGKAAKEGEKEFSGNVTIDGGNTTIGNLTVAADYVTINNLEVTGDFTINEYVLHDFLTNNLLVAGMTTINGGSSETVVFNNSNLNNVTINKADVRTLYIGTTTAKQIETNTNSTVNIGKKAKLTQLKATKGTANVELFGNIDTVKANSPMTVAGDGTIHSFVYGDNVKVKSTLTGVIDNLTLPSGEKPKGYGALQQVAKLVNGKKVTAEEQKEPKEDFFKEPLKEDFFKEDDNNKEEKQSEEEKEQEEPQQGEIKKPTIEAPVAPSMEQTTE